MRLISASLFVLPQSALLVQLTDCLEVGIIVVIVAKLVAVVAFVLLSSRTVAFMAMPRSAIPLDESELERVRLSA